jgi:hypothetical protein
LRFGVGDDMHAECDPEIRDIVLLVRSDHEDEF